MNNFKDAYKQATSSIPIDPHLSEKTARMMRNANVAKRKKRLRLSILIPVVGVIMLSTVTVFAYKATGGFKLPAEWGGYSGHVDSSMPVGVPPVVIDKVSSSENLNVTFKEFIADNELMYLTFDVETKDGTPLQQDSTLAKSTLVRQGFSEIYVECEGKKYEVQPLFRKDNAAIPNKASFEGMLFDAHAIAGKAATLVLKDLKDDLSASEDLECVYPNLAEIYKQIEPETNFIETGIYCEYADGTTVPSFTLPAGKGKVKFSNKYPNSYIDNMGIYKCGETRGDSGVQYDVLYISIVPGNDTERAALQTLQFQNISTNAFVSSAPIFGDENVEEKRAFQDGRIVIALDVSLDVFEQKQNTSVADLADYTLVENVEYTSPIMAKGEWKIPFTAKSNQSTRVFKVNKTIDKTTVDTITVTPLRMIITGSSATEKLNVGNFVFIMKDGSKVPVGVKADGTVGNTLKLEFILETIIDVEQVQAIELWGEVVVLK